MVFVQRGHTPIVVGGTGFYLRWFIYGKPTTPVSTPESSAAAQRRLDEVRMPLCVRSDPGLLPFACEFRQQR